MRLLIYGLNYAPEPIGIGKFTGELTRWLAARGHEVRAIAAPPYYPGWRIWPGWSTWCYRRDLLQDIPVYRCPLYVPRRQTGLTRLFHLLSFAWTSQFVAYWQALIWRPDLVLTVAPALACAPAALLAARLGGSRCWLHVQDFEIDAAFGLGLVQSPSFNRVARRIEAGLLRRFGRVSTISSRMRERLAVKGVAADRIVALPNWVDTDEIHPLPGPSPLREELGIAPETVIALYAGSMGEKQGLQILVETARALAARRDILFVLAGDGAARPRIEAAAAGLANLRLLPVQPPERFNDLLNLADLHLLPQRADAADLVMPSKLGGMLASGRPVVATAAPDTQIAEAIHDCGIRVPPEDPTTLARTLKTLADDPGQRRILGEQARRRAVRDWSKNAILEGFARDLQDFIVAGRNAA